MAKKSVIEIVCERCERVEYIDPKEQSTLPDLVLTFGTRPAEPSATTVDATPEATVRFEDLCSSCKNTVRNLVAQIGKKINWKRKDKGADETVDVDV